MTITFIDSGVLLTAFRGQGANQEKALTILGDPDREFVSSTFVKLEVLPKAIWYKNTDEVAFYETFFNSVTIWANITQTLLEISFREASRYGLSAIDALHIAAAMATKAEELITTEKSEKPIHRTTAVKVISIVG